VTQTEHKKEYQRQYRLKNKEKAREYARQYRIRNREKLREYDRQYYQEHKAERDAWELEHKEERKIYRRERRRTNICVRLTHGIGARVPIKYGSAIEYLCCSIEELKGWLESQFQPGMTWENYGEWHIDHVVPLRRVDLKDRKKLKKLCHWFNLQPLWAKDNQRKGAKVDSSWFWSEGSVSPGAAFLQTKH
jgi:hypothetical protein